MAHYVSLVNFTDQGVRTFKDAAQRLQRRDEMIAKEGGRVVETYITMGSFDAVLVTEFPDDAAALRALLTIAQVGNIRSTTLRAFTRPEAEAIAASL